MGRAVVLALEVAAALLDGAWCQHVEAARCRLCQGVKPTCETGCVVEGGEFGPIGVGECHPCAIAWSVEGALVRAVRAMQGIMPSTKDAAAFGYGNGAEATLEAARGALARAIWPGGLDPNQQAACWGLNENDEPRVRVGALMAWNDAAARTEPQVIAALWIAAANVRAELGELIE